MKPPPGRLILVPNALDFGVASDSPGDLREVLPLGAIRSAARLSHWVAENAKTTRAFLKRVDTVEPLALPLQSIHIAQMPRPPKDGRVVEGAGKALEALLSPAVQGHDLGLISEAGMPAIADPGATLVAAAHALGIGVLALPGPNSLLLALAASGLNGQSFAFVGYLPVEAQARAVRIRELEALSRRLQQTQLMIETPYRNKALLAALLAQLAPSTQLSVSCGLTLANGWTRSSAVSRWPQDAQELLPADVPAVFSFQAN